MRYLLGNIHDLNIAESSLTMNQLWPQDRYMLHLLHQFGQQVCFTRDHYNKGQIDQQDCKIRHLQNKTHLVLANCYNTWTGAVLKTGGKMLDFSWRRQESSWFARLKHSVLLFALSNNNLWNMLNCFNLFGWYVHLTQSSTCGRQSIFDRKKNSWPTHIFNSG